MRELDSLFRPAALCFALPLAFIGGCEEPPPPGAQERGPRAAPASVDDTRAPVKLHVTTPAKAPERPPSAPRPPATATSKAPAADGGPTDGGASSTAQRPDMALEKAVESHGRELVSCFPRAMAQPPEVTVDFQISVTGYVTRAEVSTPGIDRSTRDCVLRSANAVRFPAQEKIRDFRYELRLRRADAGTPSSPLRP